VFSWKGLLGAVIIAIASGLWLEFRPDLTRAVRDIFTQESQRDAIAEEIYHRIDNEAALVANDDMTLAMRRMNSIEPNLSRHTEFEGMTLAQLLERWVAKGGPAPSEEIVRVMKSKSPSSKEFVQAAKGLESYVPRPQLP
jgi:hypothetical protein